MKLYYLPGACSLASHILLNETGLAFALDKVNMPDKQTDSGKDFRKINPKGYVPALELENGEVLTENIAVLSYIATRGGIGLPAEGMAHWRTLETTAFISSELHKNFKPFFDRSADDAARDKAREILAARFALIDDRLGERAFIVGEDFSIADAYLFVVLNWANKQGLDMPARLKAYYKRLAKRPAVEDALQQEGLAVPV